MNVLIFILYTCYYCDAAPDWETIRALHTTTPSVGSQKPGFCGLLWFTLEEITILNELNGLQLVELRKKEY